MDFKNIRNFILELETLSINKVKFGKYKNKTYNELYCDRKYKKWLIQQKATTISMINIQEFCRKADIIYTITN